MNEADGVGPLPEPVRHRVVALASDALGRVPPDQLPASLRRVSTFAPQRRARLAATQIAAALEGDPVVRDLLGAQVRLAHADVTAALDAGHPPAAGDPVEIAALAYLLRPDGWGALVAAGAESVVQQRTGEQDRRIVEHAERVQRRLDEVTEELRATRQRQRDQVAELKAENGDLRHRLGEARTRARRAEQQAEAASLEAADAAAAGTAVAAAAEAEARRLRARVAELERGLGLERRAARTERGAEQMRTRLLLDTLLETAQGLRRELALPAVDGTPADLVEAAQAADEGSRASSGHGSLSLDDPGLLDQLLGLPRVHLVVDGYNVTKRAWPEQTLERQRELLLAGLAPLVARRGTEVSVVFDAADAAERPLVTRPRGVRVLFSPPGVIADDVIRELVAAEPSGRPVVVVTGDQAVAVDVRRDGARVVSSTALSRLLARA